MLIPSGETVVEEKSCRSCGISFVVTDRDMEFYDKVSPVFAGRKESIPTPTLCPECRQRRRLVWRNERRFYRRTSDATGKPILSIYRPDAVMPVYELSEWQKREFDIRELAPDLSGSVFSQIRCLQSSMPRPHLHAVENENCEYVNQSRSSKDCYLAFLTDHSRDCLYTQGVLRGEDMVDVHISVDSRRCYECNHVDRCSDLYFSSFCVDCRDSWFISDCRGCHHCFGSAGLVDASYVFRGERLSPDEYERRIAGLDRRDLYGFIDTERHMLDDAVRSIPHPQLRGHANEDCTGDFVSESRNSHACYTCERVEDCKYCDNLRDVRTSYDWDYVGYGGELSYECLGTGTGIYRALFCAHIWGNARNIYYCDLCMNVEDCFACVWLQNKRHCILNKQYTEEEYNELVPRIIQHMRQTGEWGEFFSPSLSPFGYNETVAMEYCPLTKEEAIAQGFNWSDYEPPFPKVEKIIPANKLPENIKDIPDDILHWAIECEVTRKPYRIIKQELEFYRKHDLPIPRRHPDQRHLDRLALRNPRRLHERTCDSCSKPIVTTYAPDRPERVYCQECYEREVYG